MTQSCQAAKPSLPRQKWLPTELWNRVLKMMPIPCVDTILENAKREILLGWRLILPYRNVWALPGGRIMKGEHIAQTSKRVLAEYGLSAQQLFLVGVFPVNFPSRSDVTICVASRSPEGQPCADGIEFSKFKWTKQLPEPIGANYTRMISRWRQISRSAEILPNFRFE
jgi:ADP-ribose pyrophosphatase YjhB (NUDIX family)